MTINTREDLAKYFNELGFKTGAEIGVLAGVYSAILCEAIPGVKLFCIDAWGWGEHKRKPYHLQAKEEAKVRLAPYDATLIHKLSMEAVKDFNDESLDFVYIDANHKASFQEEDIREWAKKVRRGGIVSGHDYDVFETASVLENYIKDKNIDLQITPKKSDKALSWWFVKK